MHEILITKPDEKTLTYKVKVAEKVIKNDPVTLFTTDNAGKALEVQALLAREQIVVTKIDNGSKQSLVLKEYTNLKGFFIDIFM